MRRVAPAAEGQVGQVESEERYGGRDRVAQTCAVLAVVTRVVCELPDSVELKLLFLGNTL